MAVFYSLLRKRPSRNFRSIEAIDALKQAAGLSVEEGKRVHLTLGSASIISPNAASALAGLSALERLSRASIASDRPPIATSGESTLTILSQEALKSAYLSGNALEAYSPEHARLSGTTPFSYAVGTIPAIRDDKVSTNILIGHLGPEAIFLSDAAESQDTTLVAASDSLEGQAVLFAAAQNPLLAEELYALPAYLQTQPFQQASLRVQDVLRWLLVAGLLGGAIFKLVESMLGASFL